MATVAQFITSARYDLRDYQTGLEFDDEELLEYINRMKDVLDNTLFSMNSSYVHGTATLTLTTKTDKIDLSSSLNSGSYDTIRSLWIGTDEKEKVSLDVMDYKKQWQFSIQDEDYALVVGNRYEILARTTLDFTGCGAAANTVGTEFTCTVTGTLGSGDAVKEFTLKEPDFWSHDGIYLRFDSHADQTYQVRVFYNKTTATLATTSNMPYADKFNQIFRELLVMHAKAKKEGAMGPAEQTYHAMFRAKAFADQIRQDYIPKRFKLDF
jgi:hypothetical protein